MDNAGYTASVTHDVKYKVSGKRRRLNSIGFTASVTRCTLHGLGCTMPVLQGTGHSASTTQGSIGLPGVGYTKSLPRCRFNDFVCKVFVVRRHRLRVIGYALSAARRGLHRLDYTVLIFRRLSLAVVTHALPDTYGVR